VPCLAGLGVYSSTLGETTLLAIGMILLTLNIFWPQLYRKTIADLAEPSVEADKTATRRAARD
jgi:hypothetical protein